MRERPQAGRLYADRVLRSLFHKPSEVELRGLSPRTVFINLAGCKYICDTRFVPLENKPAIGFGKQIPCGLTPFPYPHNSNQPIPMCPPPCCPDRATPWNKSTIGNDLCKFISEGWWLRRISASSHVPGFSFRDWAQADLGEINDGVGRGVSPTGLRRQRPRLQLAGVAPALVLDVGQRREVWDNLV